MATKRTDVIDEDGNIINPPQVDSPITAIVWLLEYGRKRGFKIGPTVQVGDTIVQVEDLRQAKQTQPQSPSELENDPDMALLLTRRDG
jgi:hypothetical protein